MVVHTVSHCVRGATKVQDVLYKFSSSWYCSSRGSDDDNNDDDGSGAHSIY